MVTLGIGRIRQIGTLCSATGNDTCGSVCTTAAGVQKKAPTVVLQSHPLAHRVERL